MTVYRDLYTSVRKATESDEVERWLNRDFENPAIEALERAREGSSLTRKHLERLAMFAASLDLRTPVSYLSDMRYFGELIPRTLKRSLERAKHTAMRVKRKGKAFPVVPAYEGEVPPVSVTMTPSSPSKAAEMKAEIVIGRELWLFSIRHRLNGVAKVLRDHSWSIVRPCQGAKWFTSDHPVLRLNYYNERKYNFNAGWASKGSEIVLPLSPTHLLYTRIGHPSPPDSELSREVTTRLQRCIAERAHRWHFADSENVRPSFFVPRVVDKEKYIAEAQEWENWHKTQTEAEADLEG